MVALGLLAALLAAGGAGADPRGSGPDGRFITLASTTSTRNSGLLDAILPAFTRKTGIAVRVVAVGTGQALRLARRGDADVLLVHDTASEERFVAEGYGVERFAVMHNDFVIVGPGSDPAGVAGSTDAPAALARVARARAAFASRGDDSGTHKAELRLWQAAGLDPRRDSGTWYRETGSGMGATLNTAAAMDAYALTDRGTWIAFENRLDLEIVVEGDPRLYNPYGVILVSPERHPHVKAAEGQAFVDWMVSAEAQRLIAGFEIGGEPLFFPDALPGDGGAGG
ncbi:MAG: substrate-binding domain-containing protein [Myxococcota bacterium]